MSELTVIEFPPRRFFAVQVVRDAGSLVVLAGPHGWLHGDEHSAVADAHWLAQNWGLPVRYWRST